MVQHAVNSIFASPARIPARVAMIEDAPAANYVIGAPSGDARGPERGVPGALFSDLPASVVRAEPPLAPAAAPVRPAPAEEAKRYRQGGQVQPGRLLRKVQPVYPALARATRASGTVQLEGVVGTDGRVRELKVVSGNPLLVRAAMDAVAQWLYEPSRLNGDLIEVVALITVTFTLN
jgi:protein TonB